MIQVPNLNDRLIPKIQSDEDKIIKVEEIKAPTAEDLEVFRNQLRIQVEGELDIDTKKSVGSILPVWVAFNYIHTWQYVPLSTRG